MMTMQQGTDEWFAARCGLVTASRIIDIATRTKSGWGAGRKNYMAQLVSETLTGKTAPSFSNAAMQWGTETEPRARVAYEFETGSRVDEVGFVLHPEVEGSGASPDGLVSDDGMVEIKCPNTATHIDYLLNKRIPKKYIYQMQWQMACADRQWCDFVSYDPRMPEEMSLWITMVERDNDLIAELEELVTDFRAEMIEMIDRLRDEYAIKERL